MASLRYSSQQRTRVMDRPRVERFYYGLNYRPVPVAEIREVPADRQLGSVFGSKLEIVGVRG